MRGERIERLAPAEPIPPRPRRAARDGEDAKALPQPARDVERRVAVLGEHDGPAAGEFSAKQGLEGRELRIAGRWSGFGDAQCPVERGPALGHGGRGCRVRRSQQQRQKRELGVIAIMAREQRAEVPAREAASRGRGGGPLREVVTMPAQAPDEGRAARLEPAEQSQMEQSGAPRDIGRSLGDVSQGGEQRFERSGIHGLQVVLDRREEPAHREGRAQAGKALLHQPAAAAHGDSGQRESGAAVVHGGESAGKIGDPEFAEAVAS